MLIKKRSDRLTLNQFFEHPKVRSVLRDLGRDVPSPIEMHSNPPSPLERNPLVPAIPPTLSPHIPNTPSPLTPAVHSTMNPGLAITPTTPSVTSISDRPRSLNPDDFDMAQGEILDSDADGITYKVLWRTRGEYYCVKSVISIGGERTNYLEQTINSLAKLHVSFIIQFFGTFTHEGMFYIVSELCTHGTLKSLIDKYRSERCSIPDKIIWQFLIQIMLGLHHLHAHSFIHTNIIPSNLFLSDADTIKIGGLASKPFLSQKAEAIVLSLYSPPEYLTDLPLISYQSDMWNVGCVLYELCFLRRPFDTGGMFELMRQILQTEPDYPSGEREEFIPIIKRLLDKNQDTRMTMDEFFSDAVVQQRARQVGYILPPRNKEREREIEREIVCDDE